MAGSRFVTRLVHQPIWLAGILSLICGFALQATALARGDLVTVQPVLVSELPLSLLIAAAVVGRRPEPRDLVAAVEMAAGLAIVLVAAAPSGGSHNTSDLRWAAALTSTVAVVAVLLGISRRWGGSARAALLGACSGLSFGLSAALLDTAASHGSHGVVSLFVSWQLYAMVVAGVSGLLFLQHAFVAGPFIAAQPPATVIDPLASVGYGLLLFGEHMRGGLLIVPELLGAAMIGHGVVSLSRSALLAPKAVARPRASGAAEREGGQP